MPTEERTLGVPRCCCSATAGGCLASQYLAAWVIARLAGEQAAREALHYVAPVGEKEAYVARALEHVAPGLEVPCPDAGRALRTP